MSRQGMNVNVNDPIYLLDKNRGYFRVKTVRGKSLVVKSLKHDCREAYNANYFSLVIDGKEHRIQKDELLAGLQYV